MKIKYLETQKSLTTVEMIPYGDTFKVEDSSFGDLIFMKIDTFGGLSDTDVDVTSIYAVSLTDGQMMKLNSQLAVIKYKAIVTVSE